MIINYLNMSSVWHNSWSILQTQGSTLNNILYLWSKDPPPPPKKGVHTKNDHAWFQTHKREHHNTWKVGCFFFFYIQVALSWSFKFFFFFSIYVSSIKTLMKKYTITLLLINKFLTLIINHKTYPQTLKISQI